MCHGPQHGASVERGHPQPETSERAGEELQFRKPIMLQPGIDTRKPDAYCAPSLSHTHSTQDDFHPQQQQQQQQQSPDPDDVWPCRQAGELIIRRVVWFSGNQVMQASCGLRLYKSRRFSLSSGNGRLAMWGWLYNTVVGSYSFYKSARPSPFDDLDIRVLQITSGTSALCEDPRKIRGKSSKRRRHAGFD